MTTERANPLRQWNPGRGGRSTARRPVVAVIKLFLRCSAFVKRLIHEMSTVLNRSRAPHVYRTEEHSLIYREMQQYALPAIVPGAWGGEGFG